MNQARIAALALGSICIVTTLSLQLLALAFANIEWQRIATATLASAVFAAGKGLFRTRMVTDVTSQLSNIAIASLCGTATSLTIAVLVDPKQNYSDWLILNALIAGGLALGIWLGNTTLKLLWSRGWLRSTAVVVGTTDLAAELAAELTAMPTFGVDVAGVVDCRDYSPNDQSLRDDIVSLLRASQATRLIVAPYDERYRAILQTARWASSKDLAVFVVPRLHEMGMGLDSLSPDRVRGYPLVRVQRSAHPFLTLRLKRVIDLLVSATALVSTMPIMICAAAAIRVSSPGPALFRQTRVGLNGREFVLYKLRSMTPDGDPDTEWASDRRVTPVGAFLRRSAIDELPQLYSVVRGDMSLVGPRPERPTFVAHFKKTYDHYDDRLRMRPGITGLAQVVGLVGDSPIDERLKYDNLYIDQWSLSWDLQIASKTLWSLVNQSKYRQQQIDLASAVAGAGAVDPGTATDRVAPPSTRVSHESPSDVTNLTIGSKRLGGRQRVDVVDQRQLAGSAEATTGRPASRSPEQAPPVQP